MEGGGPPAPRPVLSVAVLPGADPERLERAARLVEGAAEVGRRHGPPGSARHRTPAGLLPAGAQPLAERGVQLLLLGGREAHPGAKSPPPPPRRERAGSARSTAGRRSP